MKKINLGNLYESPFPLENVNDLWADIDEDSKDIRAVHRYNKGKSEWEPYLVSVDYIKPDDSLPPGWNRAMRKTFQVTSYKTFVQQFNENTYNVVGILVDTGELIESIGYVADFYSDGAAIVNSEDTTVTVIGDLSMNYEYPIRIVFTPDYEGPWESHTTVNKPLQISVTENLIV